MSDIYTLLTTYILSFFNDKNFSAMGQTLMFGRLKTVKSCLSSNAGQVTSEPCSVTFLTCHNHTHLGASHSSSQNAREALPALGRPPQAAEPGSPPSTHHPGLLDRSFHRLLHDSSLEGKNRNQTRMEEQSLQAALQGPQFKCLLPEGNKKLTTKCQSTLATCNKM